MDIHELAIEAAKKKIVKYPLKNVAPILVKDIGQIKDNVADIIIAIDMFHMVKDTELFTGSLKTTVIYLLKDRYSLPFHAPLSANLQ